MWSLLDAIGATILGSMFMLMVITVTMNMNDSVRDLLENNIAQYRVSETAEIIRSDFYRMGYLVPSNKIAAADSNRILFYSDLDNNGIVDTLEYKTDATFDLTLAANQVPLLRIQNNQTLLIATVSDFQLTYRDSTGAAFTYVSLSSSVNRSRIKGISVEMTMEIDQPDTTVQKAATWKSTIRPRNL
ncbi:MAG: hypothetical protein KJ799_17055 [Bacteroidetes bacterium]|nr:hypothetical protein [Bacteroidota bacterium]MBU1681063.1 hypothetical protein [Bacteroidota bacterium]MBU2508407.1 hypothetical protein [Bacteroidota bacterium]